jgi:hypothetical protein
MKNFKWSLLFAVPALFAYCCGAFLYDRRDWRPVSALRSEVSAEFTADMTDDYLINAGRRRFCQITKEECDK